MILVWKENAGKQLIAITIVWLKRHCLRLVLLKLENIKNNNGLSDIDLGIIIG